MSDETARAMEALKKTLEDVAIGGDGVNATERMRAALCLAALDPLDQRKLAILNKLHRIVNGHSVSG